MFQHAHWADLLSMTEQDDIQSLTETERKRREAVWELFQSECVFLIDHLMVLKHVSNSLSLLRPTTLIKTWTSRMNIRAAASLSWRIK